MTYYNQLTHHCIDTTGLQSSVAVVELNNSITVTCTFATGALSTGCQVSIFKLDSLQEVFLISGNFTRLYGTKKVNYLYLSSYHNIIDLSLLFITKYTTIEAVRLLQTSMVISGVLDY